MAVDSLAFAMRKLSGGYRAVDATVADLLEAAAQQLLDARDPLHDALERLEAVEAIADVVRRHGLLLDGTSPLAAGEPPPPLE